MSVLTLTSADNGKLIEASRDDELVLRLPENPTTGFRWHIDRADAMLKQEADSYVPEPNKLLDPGTQFGSGGVRELRFRVVSSGLARLELKLWQEWEGEASVAERFTLAVSVAG